MRISAVVPAYNAAKTVAATLDSLLAQSHPPVEVVVVDDGSKDATRAALEPYRDRAKLVFQANSGVSAARNRAGRWVFSVRDNGLGIELQYFDRIFGMFQRLHKREEFAGTGIGLAICRKIAERHGGTVTVESEPGRGSTFRFSLAGVAGEL